MSSKHLKKLVLLASAMLATCAMFAQPAATQGPAAPFIVEPGLNQTFPNGNAVITARVFCGDWHGVARLTVGIHGQRFVTRTVYICQSDAADYANLRFVVRASQLGPDGNYQYKITVGRHDANGNVTRWTHGLTGSFRLE